MGDAADSEACGTRRSGGDGKGNKVICEIYKKGVTAVAVHQQEK